MKVVGIIGLGLAVAAGLSAAAAPPGIVLPPHFPRPGFAARPPMPNRPPAVTPAPAAAADADAATDETPSFVLSADDPYGTIVARNIFGLVPIPPPAPPPPPPEDPPPKITANGIMNVFGDLEALFKVSLPAKGKDPAKDQSYVLMQGQRQDDIEVTKIDAVNATITFDNHGTVQEIPLVAADKDAPSTGGLGRFRGGFTGVGGPGVPALARNNNPSQNNPAPPPVGNPQIYQPPINSDLTPEQNAVLIEAQREAGLQQQQNGDTPKVNPKLYPPTKYTLPPPP